MRAWRKSLLASLAAGAVSIFAVVGAAPLSAQVFYAPPPVPAQLMTTLDPAFDPAMPGATPAEERAVLVWSLRQGLLLGALQCHTQHPTLLTTSHYNTLLTNHAAELSSAFNTISGYFKRTQKGAKAAQDALDRFATRMTTSYSTVQGQQSFCHTAGWVGRRAIFAPRGLLSQVAIEHLGALRNSLKGAGEQQFRIPRVHVGLPITPLPSLDPKCWTKRNTFNEKKCGRSQRG